MKKNAKLKKKVPSQLFYRHPAATQETFFLRLA